MIFVWGRKQYVQVSYDQSALTNIVTIDRPAPCLNVNCTSPMVHGCRKIYLIKQYCTIYFCIPLCEVAPAIEVVKCNACGKIWQLDPYLAIVARAAAAQRGGGGVFSNDLELQQQLHHHPTAGPVRQVLTVMKPGEEVPFAYGCVPVSEPAGEDDDEAEEEEGDRSNKSRPQQEQQNGLPVVTVSAPSSSGTLL